ncbi:MAG TPA: nitrilase-related carbon-nitrogen hydrolase [Anaerolineae bacterium]
MALKDYLLSSATRALLAYRSRPSAIRGALSRRPYSHAAAASADSVVIGVIQMRLDLIDDGVAFALKYYDLVRQAVERGAQLIVFPEYAWLPILGLLPSVREWAAEGGTLQAGVEELAPGGGLTIESVFRTMVPAVQRIFETTGRELARRFGVYLMSGSAITADRAGRLFNAAYLFGPGGELIGTQRKLHQALMEKNWNWLSVGSEVGVFELPFGILAMPVGIDHAYWETGRSAGMRNVDILLGSSHVENENELFKSRLGVTARIQESYAYGAEACCVTKLFGLSFGGPSDIVAPLGAWDNESIFMAQTKTDDAEEVIAARLDLAFLRKWRAAHPRDLNVKLYRKYLPRAYEMYRTRVTQDGRRKV